MRRFLRYLRIAFSATCLIACLSFAALWLRSYWWLDALNAKPPELQLNASSLNGKLVFERKVGKWHDWDAVHPWELTSGEVDSGTYLGPLKWEAQYSRLNISIYDSPNYYGYVVVPHYYPVALTAIVAGIPWIPWSLRFRLRTLLIAMTLSAGVLGLYVYLRAPAGESRAALQQVRRKMAEAPIDRDPPDYTPPANLKPNTSFTLSGGLNP